jgi:hypothetical protein
MNVSIPSLPARSASVMTSWSGTAAPFATSFCPPGLRIERYRKQRAWYPLYFARRIGPELVVLAVMTLARIDLVAGRPVELMSLTIALTYGGLLEGYPNARMNDALIAGLGRRRGDGCGSPPVHVIPPPRSRPEPGQGTRMPFGPVETLPAVYCEGLFRSRPVDGKLDPVLHESLLLVVWFQDDLARPVADFAASAVRGLAWDHLAEDTEL